MKERNWNDLKEAETEEIKNRIIGMQKSSNDSFQKIAKDFNLNVGNVNKAAKLMGIHGCYGVKKEEEPSVDVNFLSNFPGHPKNNKNSNLEIRKYSRERNGKQRTVIKICLYGSCAFKFRGKYIDFEVEGDTLKLIPSSFKTETTHLLSFHGDLMDVNYEKIKDVEILEKFVGTYNVSTIDTFLSVVAPTPEQEESENEESVSVEANNEIPVIEETETDDVELLKTEIFVLRDDMKKLEDKLYFKETLIAQLTEERDKGKEGIELLSKKISELEAEKEKNESNASIISELPSLFAKVRKDESELFSLREERDKLSTKVSQLEAYKMEGFVNAKEVINSTFTEKIMAAIDEGNLSKASDLRSIMTEILNSI